MRSRILSLLFSAALIQSAFAQNPQLDPSVPDLHEILPLQDSSFLRTHKIKSITCYADVELKGNPFAQDLLLIHYRYDKNGGCVERVNRNYQYFHDTLWSFSEYKIAHYRMFDSILYSSNRNYVFPTGQEWWHYHITSYIDDTLYREENGDYLNDSLVSCTLTPVKDLNEPKRIQGIKPSEKIEFYRINQRYRPYTQCDPQYVMDSLNRKSKKLFYEYGYHRPYCGNDDGLHCEVTNYYEYIYDSSSRLTSFSMIDTVGPRLFDQLYPQLTVPSSYVFTVNRNKKGKGKSQKQTPEPAPEPVVEAKPPVFIYFIADIKDHSQEGVPTLIQTEFYDGAGATLLRERRNYRIVLEYYP